MRIGVGYDIHRLVKGRPLFLGGLRLPFSKGLLGHSDGDVLIHAITDSILGACASGDIGGHFPDTDKRFKDISSVLFLKEIKKLLDEKGLRVGNIDCVVVAEKPKIILYADRMKKKIAGALGVRPSAVGIKGKTNEKLGEIGAGRAIAAWSVALLEEKKRRKP